MIRIFLMGQIRIRILLNVDPKICAGCMFSIITLILLVWIRSEYFHGMFSSRWAEAETNLKLPIQESIKSINKATKFFLYRSSNMP